MQSIKNQKPKTKIYKFSEVDVIEWEMIGVINGRQQFQFVVACESKQHLGEFQGTTQKTGVDFVLAIMAYPDKLYDVELRVTPTGICTMLSAKSHE